MPFAEEFSDLDASRLESAHSNVMPDLLLLARGDEELTPDKVSELFDRINAASPGFLAALGRQEEAIQMIGSVPGMEYGEERYRMIQMTLGLLSAGLILTEYSRLESED